ncbi:MFS transporter [Fervidibacillus albus]|uniref:MFS transporter n=1 Tax=Fervidibacillus albus TaxID=2980026 RepID=A0A9E8LSC1_9BACI|nr:MFS transporter [Fervidibacillus albus]WAA08695.1 MFS transporter [Fervidibacillus albus]
MNQRTVTGLLLVITGIFVASNIYALIPLYRTIADRFEVSERIIMYGSTCFTFCYAWGLLLFGPLSDRFGRKRIILLGLCLSTLTTSLVSISVDPIDFLVYRSVQGFTLASFAPVSFLYAFDLFAEKERTLWIGLINAGFLAAGMLGQLLSSAVNFVFGWREVFLFYSIVYAFLFLCGTILFPQTARKKEESQQRLWNQYKTIASSYPLIGYYGITFTLLFAFVSFFEAVNQFFPSATVHLVRSTSLIGTFFTLFVSYFLEKSKKKTLIGGICLGLFCLLSLFFVRSPFTMGLFGILFVASISILIPTVIHFIGSFHPELRGKALSLYSFILLIGASFGSLLNAFLSYETVLPILFICFTFNLTIGLFIDKEKNGT